MRKHFIQRPSLVLYFVLFLLSSLVFIASFLHLLRCIFFPFSFLYFYLFSLSCFCPPLPTHSSHLNSFSSTSAAPLQRPHLNVVRSWSEGAPKLQQESNADIQIVIVPRFLAVLKTDPMRLTKYLRVIINHKQNGGLLSKR
jgi:hypothetical protein